jgi:hypothetical protein
MRPNKPRTTGEGDLFRARLDQIINMKHETGEREQRQRMRRNHIGASAMLNRWHSRGDFTGTALLMT